MSATKKIATLTMVLALGCAAWGQQQTPAPSSGQSSSKPGNANGPLQPITIKPLQPDQPLNTSPNGDQSADQSDTDTPVVPTIDRRPLSGIQSVDVQTPIAKTGGGGGGLDRRGELTSSFSFSQTFTNVPEPAGIGGTFWRGQDSLAGNVRYSRNFGENGGLTYQGLASWNSYQQTAFQYHQIGYDQRFRVGRVSFVVSDNFAYTPDSAFGFAGLQGLAGAGFNPLTSNLGQFGLLPSGLNPSLLPNDSILTGNAGRVNNTTAVETDYSFTGRTSATFNGSYGLFHAMGSGLLDSNQYSVGGGLNHMFNANVTMSAQYNYGDFSFPSSQRDIVSHTIGVSAAYRVSGRLSLHGTGNVEISDITDPSLATSSIFGGGSVGATYVRSQTSLAFNYFRGLTTGSGILPGAKTNLVTASVSRTYHRVWSYGVTSGYSHNEEVNLPLRFETEFVGVSVSRPLGRMFSLYANYSMQHQKGTTLCAIAICDQGTLTHAFGLGISWNPRPLQVF